MKNLDGRISNFDQVASLRRYTLTEGKGVGLDVIDCDNGKLRFLLNVTKGLDVMQLYHKGENVSFLSKNAFSARETDFLSRFEGGMLYTCGLDSVGGREGYPLHGTYHNMTAEVTRTECNEDGITVEAIIRSTALFGRNLVMYRRVSTAVGGDTFSIEDRLVNRGFGDENYCLLYHVNVGYPMLDDGATIEADVLENTARSSWSEQHKATFLQMESPVPCKEETCYFLKLAEPKVSLTNKKNGKRFTLAYSGDTLPAFIEWKSMASADYALGLEPATTYLDDKFVYKTLAPEEEVSFALRFTVTEID